jgi:hypothetical protein
MIVPAALTVYYCQPWSLKTAVTPLALSNTVYLYFLFGPLGVESIGAFCQLADAIGLLFLLAYASWIWNRRNRDDRTAEKTAHKEKAVPSHPPQMKIVSHQGRH